MCLQLDSLTFRKKQLSKVPPGTGRRVGLNPSCHHSHPPPFYNPLPDTCVALGQMPGAGATGRQCGPEDFGERKAGGYAPRCLLPSSETEGIAPLRELVQGGGSHPQLPKGASGP